MLWQQELSSTLYVDILENISYTTDFASLNCKKNNNASKLARTIGNQKYSEGDYYGAMVLYNKGVCYAENGSEYLSLCYCNRSMCFLKLECYDECLVDIGLAKNGNCPVASLKKLGLREEKCLTKLNLRGPSSETTLRLLEADGDLPYLSNGLTIEKKTYYGRMVTSKNDIQIGETLLVEENYIRTDNTFDFRKCTTCAKVQMNFIPCENCSTAMYCDEHCAKKNNFHELECDMVLESNHCCNGLHLPFILRSIIVGINSFTTIIEMMECVEKLLSDDPHKVSKSLTSPISKYETFFKLSSTEPQQQVSRFRKSSYMIFNSAMKSTKFASKFQTTAAQRFLIHLIIHHCCITQINSFGQVMIGDAISNEYNSISIDLVTSYFNHSCIPNIVRLEKDRLTVIKAISPIKAGEQIFITYLEAFSMDRTLRQNQLENMYGFKCKCRLCVEGAMKVNGLQDDSIFLHICSESSKVSLDSFNIDLILNLKNSCVEFLMKYRNYITSRETNFVMDIFGECLRRILIER